MNTNYEDILNRIEEPPSWWDSNGTPRYGKFHPSLCPNIYSHYVWLYRIACQSCGQEFLVEGHASPWFGREKTCLPKKDHYGDPPIHGCVGDTMNCDDLEVLEVWEDKDVREWVRRPDLEGPMDEGWNEGKKTSEEPWDDD